MQVVWAGLCEEIVFWNKTYPQSVNIVLVRSLKLFLPVYLPIFLIFEGHFPMIFTMAFRKNHFPNDLSLDAFELLHQKLLQNDFHQL